MFFVFVVFTGGVYAQKKKVCAKFDENGRSKCCKARSFATCPAKGCGGDPLLNLAKNRTDETPGDVEQKTITEIANFKRPKSWVSGTPRSKLVEWGEGTPLSVSLYLQKVTNYPSGAESCNCNLRGDGNNDFHIVLGRTPKAPEKQSLTAEISPRIRRNNWEYKTLTALAKKKTYVRVTGWAMLDTQHVGKPVPVRRTHWEIHPVTKFEVCTTTRDQCDTRTGWRDLEDLP